MRVLRSFPRLAVLAVIGLMVAGAGGVGAQTIDKKVLSLAAARKVAAAAEEAAKAKELDVVIVVVGAIGVSGDTPQIDEDIAIAGARAFK